LFWEGLRNTNHSPLSVGNGPSVDRIQFQTFCAIGDKAGSGRYHGGQEC
jgi:hypothetical protein